MRCKSMKVKSNHFRAYSNRVLWWKIRNGAMIWYTVLYGGVDAGLSQTNFLNKTHLKKPIGDIKL